MIFNAMMWKMKEVVEDTSQNIILKLTLCLLLACGGCDSGSGIDGSESDTTPPVLKNLTVQFGTWDGEDGGRAGDFVISSSPVWREHVINPMGQKDSSSSPYSEITFFTVPDADVISPVDGVVTNIFQKEGEPEGEMGVIIKPSSNSIYFVDVDHVSNVQVSEGQHITAGTLLGQVGHWSEEEGVVELHIVDDEVDNNLCPMDFLDSSKKSTLTTAVAELMENWEEVKGDSTIYDQASMTIPGCYQDSILSSEL